MVYHYPFHSVNLSYIFRKLIRGFNKDFFLFIAVFAAA